MQDTSGKWIREGDSIFLLDNDFNKVGTFVMAFLNMKGD